MHYTVTYNPKAAGDREMQSQKACMEYLGRAAYLAKRRQLVDYILSQPGITVATAYRRIRIACVMLGMNGYWPARAMARHVLRVVRDIRAV